MNKREKYYYLISFSTLIFLPIIAYPFGLNNSLGFLVGTATGLLVISHIEFSVQKYLTPKKKKYLLLGFLLRLFLLFVLLFFLSLYQEQVSVLTFALGFAIIIFVMLFSYLVEE